MKRRVSILSTEEKKIEKIEKTQKRKRKVSKTD
jgi:hypothetical protein